MADPGGAGVHPDLVFLSEAFTRPAMMATLAKAGFSQSYTYFTWRNTRARARAVRDWSLRPTPSQFLRPNFFANTPDILTEYLRTAAVPRSRLASSSPPRCRRATGSTPATSVEAIPLRAGSEEYLDSEKYELKARTLDGPLLPMIARLNATAAATRAAAHRQRDVPRHRERPADRVREARRTTTQSSSS